MKRKIAFFDIDGTLTSEIDGSVPESAAEGIRRASDRYFTCIDRGGCFREFIPHGYSKATGLQFVLDYYGLSLEEAYGFGDSNNDLTMLQYLRHSVAMGNTESKELLECASFVTRKASRDGIYYALEQLGFFER